MVQMARHAVDESDGALLRVRFVLHDHDAKFCNSFQSMLQSGRSAVGKSISAAHQLNAVRMNGGTVKRRDYEMWQTVEPIPLHQTRRKDGSQRLSSPFRSKTMRRSLDVQLCQAAALLLRY